MLSKKNHPKIELKGWINVEGEECLISNIYTGYSLSGACEVVTNPERPINMDVGWDGEKWFFSKDEPLVNAVKTSRLREFLEEFQQEHAGKKFFDK